MNEPESFIRNYGAGIGVGIVLLTISGLLVAYLDHRVSTCNDIVDCVAHRASDLVLALPDQLLVDRERVLTEYAANCGDLTRLEGCSGLDDVVFSVLLQQQQQLGSQLNSQQ
jgi:hypothetical protein